MALASALLHGSAMEKVNFQPGDIIMMDGLYGCSSETCGFQAWGISGRRFARPACGHETEWKLIRRRVDNWW